MAEEAAKYEFVFLTPLEVDEKALSDTFSELEKQIKLIKGEIEDKEEIGRKPLAYQIKGKDQAKFWAWYLQFPEETKIEPLNTYLNRNENIIRYLFLRR